MQEHHIALPFAHLHRGIGDAGKLLGERGQLMIMRGEQRAAAVDLMQMLDRRPGDGEAVEGRGAAADLVENDEANARSPG